MSDSLAGLSVDELRARVAAKQEELVGIRAERLQAQADAQADIEAAQLIAELNRVQGTIDQEKALLEAQQQIDPVAVATGLVLDTDVQIEPQPKVPEAPDAPPIPDPDPNAETTPSVAPGEGTDVASEGASTDKDGDQ